MYEKPLTERLPDALVRATQHWESHRKAATDDTDLSARQGVRFSIAISRQTGAQGAILGREIAGRLGWPVYDHELIERIAHDMHVRASLLESVDEKMVSWIQECLESFAALQTVSQSAYVHHLVETLLSLGSHGQCVIVGRGAPHILPSETTLRVRVVAPLHERVAVVGHRLGLSRDAAEAQIKASDQERIAFVKGYFQVDPVDPAHYDLVINSFRFSIEECVQLILGGLERLRSRS